MRFFAAFVTIASCHAFVNKGPHASNSRPFIDRSLLLAAGSDPYYSIETSSKGPGESVVHTLTIHKLPGQTLPSDSSSEKEKSEPAEVVNGDSESIEESLEAIIAELTGPVHVPEPPLVIETGKIGRQAAGAVTLTRGDTVLYATASRDEEPKSSIDFLPLSVEHQERFSSAGTTSGSYTKRDGRPAEHEVLTCRLIDRPIRPLIADGWRHETQLLSWVLSYDGVRSCDPLAVTASAAALYLSDIPLSKPVAAVMVGYDKTNDSFILNPTNDEMKASALQLVVAGTKDAVLMIEGAADFLSEDTMLGAVTFGHEAIKVICEAMEELGKVAGAEKKLDTLLKPPPGLQERVDELMADQVDEMYAAGGTKTTQGPRMSALKASLLEQLSDEFPDQQNDIKDAFKDLLCRRMYARAQSAGVRCDGRQTTEIRKLDMETGFLPRVHGSALFTRGETQSIATATLGGAGMKQKIDTLDGVEEKRFYLQYTFPPSCVGETGRVGAPGRREVGHGNLAERALIPTLPPESDFPFTIRVESLITESHGSSSMASVCGGTLALMDAGVPIKSPVAGIAMGMLLGDKSGVSDENAIILSDILGTEDALGTMDFKVAGDRNGITTFQLDIKCEGLTLETMQRALEQARQGRLHILDAMENCISKPNEELPATVPKIKVTHIPPETKGRVIGPGGKQIRQIIEDFKLESCDVSEEGEVQMVSFDSAKLDEAVEFIQLLTSAGGGGSGRRDGKGGDAGARAAYAGPPPVEGDVYKGKITGIHDFGVFVEFLPGAEDGSTPGLEGLVHVSELAKDRVRNCPAFIKSMGVDELEVRYMGINDRGKHSLSRKAVLDSKYGAKTEKKDSAPSMPPDEIDVIAAAIEDIKRG